MYLGLSRSFFNDCLCGTCLAIPVLFWRRMRKQMARVCRFRAMLLVVHQEPLFVLNVYMLRSRILVLVLAGITTCWFTSLHTKKFEVLVCTKVMQYSLLLAKLHAIFPLRMKKSDSLKMSWRITNRSILNCRRLHGVWYLLLNQMIRNSSRWVSKQILIMGVHVLLCSVISLFLFCRAQKLKLWLGTAMCRTSCKEKLEVK